MTELETITDTAIAKFYGTTTRSLRNWKKDEVLNRRYLAFKRCYMELMIEDKEK